MKNRNLLQKLWLVPVFILGFQTLAFGYTCGEEEKKSNVYKAFQACHQALAAKTSGELNQILGRLGELGFCTTFGSTGQSTNGELCNDPGAFACSHANGQFFDDKCELWIVDSKDAANVPDYVDANCRFESKEDDLLSKHKSECPASQSVDDCTASLQLKYRDELLKAERDAIYTPDKIKKLQEIFKQVLAMYVQTLNESKTLSVDQKQILLSRIQLTQLELPIPENDAPDCVYPDDKGPDTGIYNDSQGHIVFCAGAIALLDSVNRYDLIHTLSHELSHSIDPCELEAAANVAPADVRQLYGPLMKCLRGGSGPDGCNGSILNCNSQQGVEAAIEEAQNSSIAKNPASYSDQKSKDGLHKKLEDYMIRTPDCSHGPTDPTYKLTNLSDFYKGKYPQDQIGESFADFMGAEVAGRIMKQDGDSGHLTAEDRANALATLASDNSRLHGNCSFTNTHDPHPPGYIRVNHVIMGSSIFRDEVGCSAPPAAAHAGGTTCSGL